MLEQRLVGYWPDEALYQGAMEAADIAELIGDTEETVMAAYSHIVPDDRACAREAMERFFSRAGRNPASASARRDVP